MKMSTGKHSLKLHLVLLALLIAVVGFVIWLYTGYVGESTPYEVTNYAMGTYVQQYMVKTARPALPPPPTPFPVWKTKFPGG